MATIKSYCDLQQSKKLAEILPLESADMCYVSKDDRGIEFFEEPDVIDGTLEDVDIRCWSLAALLGVLPEIQGGKPVIALDDNYIAYPHMSDLHTKADNLVDACYEVIIKLYELKML